MAMGIIMALLITTAMLGEGHSHVNLFYRTLPVAKEFRHKCSTQGVGGWR